MRTEAVRAEIAVAIPATAELEPVTAKPERAAPRSEPVLNP
jgi:hypothetical protein